MMLTDASKSSIENVEQDVILTEIHPEDSKADDLPVIMFREYVRKTNFDGSRNEAQGVLKLLNTKKKSVIT